MATLSVVLIVKNEAASLAACLETVGWADEIVVLDGGSKDNTVEIARKYTNNIFVKEDWQGFGKQRQTAQQKATGDWVFMIDADERVTPELQAQVLGIMKEDDRMAVYAVPRLSWCFGGYIRHSGWYPDYVNRIYPRGKARYGDERVHEKLYFDKTMTVKELHGDLLHFTYRNLEHYLIKSANYAREWANDREQAGKRASLLQGIVHGVACFVRMYIVKAGLLDGKRGFLLALLSAHSTFVKYADLWTRRQPKPPSH